MPKISWNDINDSDSSLSSDSETHEGPPVTLNQQGPNTPNPDNKLKIACDKVSLTKIENHEKEEVWLFVPNSFYDRADQVHKTLQQCKRIKQLTRMKGVGWNILADYADAKSLISEGVTQDDITIKFIYSTRNDNKPGQTQEKQKTSKMQKKVTYVQKGNNSPQFHKTLSAIDQTNAHQNSHKEEKVPSLKPVKSQKPKVKWVQKQNKTVYEEKKVNGYSQRLQSPRSPRLNKNTSEVKSPKRYVLKKSEDKCQQVQKVKQEILDPQPEPINRQEQEAKIEYIVPDAVEIAIKEPLPQDLIAVDQPQRCLEKQPQKRALSEDDSSEAEEQPKKRKKKKKKAKNGAKEDKRDHNNPFSYFAQ